MIKSRRAGLAGHVSCMQLKSCACTVLVGKPERKGPLGKPRNRQEGNIKLELKEIR
jgi:hypothetical protein